MWVNIPSLQDALAEAELREFRERRGKRYELQSLLLLSCIAMMNGARTEAEIAAWLEASGERWLKWLGVRGGRCPSAATIARLFRGVDAARLEAALLLWGQQVLDSLRLAEEEEWEALEERAEIIGEAGEAIVWAGRRLEGAALIGALSHRLNAVLDRLYGTSDWERMAARRESLLAGLALTGYVEAEELGARLPLHGPLTDLQEERDRAHEGRSVMRPAPEFPAAIAPA